MNERRASTRHRTYRGGKIVFNSGRSAIDCTVRNLSDEGVCLDVQTPVGIPDEFYLIVSGDEDLRECKTIWRSSDRIGAAFKRPEAMGDTDQIDGAPGTAEPEGAQAERLSFRAALDRMQIGIVLLDHELRAQLINPAFRVMFRLPDAKADSKPPFVALMYHGRDTLAYELPANDLDRYVAERVALVKAGDTNPIDIRLSDGEVLRFQCAVLPDGGRMLSYTYVTDIVRYADELTVLRAALDRVREGIVLLDPSLDAQFMNRAVRELWRISDKQAARHPNIADLIGAATTTQAYAVSAEELPGFIARRIADIRAGNPEPTDLRTRDGRIIRAQCDPLPSGGRMLTYCDVTDLVRSAEQVGAIATMDAATGVCSRRHFLAMAETEWDRFQRYQRPLSLLVLDIDYFKSVNDRFGHDVGDATLREVARILQAGRRSSDVVARFGGDEFVLLLPEADAAQAAVVAERLCADVGDYAVTVGDRKLSLSVSIGVAAAAAGMSAFTALMKAADDTLFQAKSRGRNRFVVAGSDNAAVVGAARQPA